MDARPQGARHTTPPHRAWTLQGNRRRGGSRVARPLTAALAASAIALLSGGVVGHAVALSTTTLVSGLNPSTYGQSVTFTATITPVAPAPTGTVTFQDGGANIAGCVNRAVAARVATCAVTTLAAATHTITAVYSGNGTYAGSTSIAVMQVVNAGGTTTALAASANPSVSGQTVTYTATVTATAPAAGTRTGTVNFEDGGVTIAGCGAKAVAAAGTATCAVAYAGPGSHSITAIYSGDSNFNGSTSATLSQTVNQGATSTALGSSVNPSSTGANVTFTATVSAIAPASGTRTGTVNFKAAGVTITGCGAQVVAASGKATCVTNALAVGTTAITAVYSGDVNFTGSTSSTLTQVVNQGATTTTVVSSLNPSSTGVNVTFTATVKATAPASGTRTGTVDFQDGGVDIAGCGAQTVSAAGTATCTAGALAAGAHAITATYSGDTNFVTSTSAPLTQKVVSTTSTAVTSNANPSVYGQSVQYTATVTGGPVVTGTITFRDGAAGIAGCVAVPVSAGSASCTVSPTAGSHTITAVYSGDATNAASTSPALTQVVGADTTTTVIAATANPLVYGQSVTFTATVSANAPGAGTPTGNVAFQNGGVNIGGCGSVALVAGVATCTTTTLSVGSHSIVGLYKGSASFLVSTSVVYTQTVNKGATATVVTSSVNPSVSGQSVTYVVTVSAVAPAAGISTGPVAFQDAGVNIAGCGAKPLAAGTASCTVTYGGAGAHSITATYGGDTHFAGSTSPVFTQSISQASTSTALASSMNPSVAGQLVTLTATVSVIAPGAGTPTGTVDFQDGGLDIVGCAAQPLSGTGTATCSTSLAAVGTHVVTALYGGDANFTGSSSPTVAQTVNQGATAVLVGSSVNPSVPGEIVTYTGTVTAVAPSGGTPTGTITFSDGASSIGGCVAQPLIGGVASCTVAYAGVGLHMISALYSGDTNYMSSTSPSIAQDVNQGATTATLASSANPSVAGQALTLTATVSVTAPGAGTPTGTVLFQDGGVTITGCAVQTVSGSGTAICATALATAGIHTITASYGGDTNFLGSTSSTFDQVVNQAATATVVSSAVNPSVTGQPVTYTAVVSVIAPGAGTPTGAASFMDGATAIGGCLAQPLIGGVASCTVGYNAVGTHTITAAYGGDTNDLSSTAPALTQTVDQAATTTAVASSVNPSVAGQALTITATVSVTAPGAGTPTGAVDFESGGATITGCGAQPASGSGTAACVTSFPTVGTYPITAVYSGDTNFAGSTSPGVAQTVNQGSTGVVVNSTVDPSVTGQMVTYSATVAALAPAAGTPTGTVTFMDGASIIGGCSSQTLSAGVTSCTVAYAGVGTHAIAAVYGGDLNFSTSTSSVLLQTVDQGATATVIASSANPSMSGQGLTYTATVTTVAPASGTLTGSVTFLEDATVVSGCAAQPLVGGVASCSVTFPDAGTFAMSAVYSGDANFDGSTSPTLAQTVAQGSTTTTMTSSSNGIVVAGYAVTLTATIAPASPASGVPTGTVEFMDGTAPISGCTAEAVVGGIAECSVVYADAGVHAMSAVYSGDHDFAASTSPSFTMTVSLDPSVPDTGTHATPSVWGGIAVLGGFLLLCLGTLVRRRGRSAA